MIAVVVPVHDEADLLPRCLDAVERARAHPGLGGEPVTVWVVLDACTDGSAAIAARYAVERVEVEVRNVGAARAAGAERALAAGARWLAFTDGDTRVADDWLVAQIGVGAELVCGTVEVDDWLGLSMAGRVAYADHYVDADGHRHIHGANLGISAAAYRAAQGFEPRQTGEDVALVAAVERLGLSIAWSARPRVITSARRSGRAPAGFAAFVDALWQSCPADSPPPESAGSPDRWGLSAPAVGSRDPGGWGSIEPTDAQMPANGSRSRLFERTTSC